MSNKSPLDDPRAAALLGNASAIKSIMNSPDAKKIVGLLGRSAGGDLNSVAQSALKGDTTQLMELMNQLMEDPEGAQAVQNLGNSIKK